MKYLLPLLLAVTLANAATNQVAFDLGIFTSEGVAYKQVRIRPSRVTFPRGEGSQVIGIDYGFKTTDANGKFTNAMVTGTYDIEFTNRFMMTPFQITVPATNASGILTAAELTTSGTNLPSNLAAYSQAASDARYVRGVAQGTNGILTVTNSGVVTVHFTGSVSGGGSATNAVATIKTNNATVGTGVTSLEFTNGSNTIVSASASGSSVTVTVSGPDTNALGLRLTSVESQTNTLGSRATSLESQTNALGTRATNLENVSNLWQTVHGPQIAGLSNSVASKQHGTAMLTNLSGTGALTNITSANSAFTSLLQSSNQPVVKTISGAGAATVTDNGTNIVIETSAASGEANVNGEVFTNATRIGSVYDKQGVTNRLRSHSAGKGMTLTNESTNIVFAAEVSTADLTAAVGTTNAYIKSLGGLGTNNGFTTPTNYQIASFWDRSREGDTDHHFYFVVTNGLFELWSDLMVNEPWFSIGDPNEGLNFSQSYHISAGSFLGQKVQATPANTTLTAFEAYAKTGGTAHMMAVYDTNSTTEMFVITSNGTVRTEHVWPLAHVAYDIGSPSLYYRTGYFAALTVTNIDVRGTLDVETLTATSTPFQWGTATLTNLSENANKSYTNALVAGWGLVLVTNTGVTTVTPTNYAASVATNATTYPLDFSDTVNKQEIRVWWHLTTNLTLFPTNPVVGRTLKVFFDTNSLTYDVTVTNAAATPVNWNFNVTTNGAANITKTNTLRARLYLTAETNGTYTAEWGYYR